jgi:hypothetical protein
MKYILTEQQNDKMVEKLTNSIKSDGWLKTTKLVGGNENLIKLLGITSPMDFLHLFDDMDVVQSKEKPNWTLFRYSKGNNLMVLDKKNEDINLDYFEIWSILENVFGLSYSYIQKLIIAWLDEVYNLSDVIPDFYLVYNNNIDGMRYTI